MLTTVLSVFLATAAYALSRWFFGKRGATSFFLTSQMFPAVILLVPLFQLLAIRLGLLNTPWALVLAYATTAIPFCVLMLKSYFDTLPIELEEAAKIDGLGPLGAFWRIVIPLSTPGIAVTAFYAFITAWNEFLYALASSPGRRRSPSRSAFASSSTSSPRTGAGRWRSPWSSPSRW